jgi:hypothetical protein
MASHMLTTDDNPWDPFTQFDEWYAWDERAGYNTCSLLARLVRYSDDMSEADQEFAIDSVIDEIVSENLFGHYRKVEEPSAAASVASG